MSRYNCQYQYQLECYRSFYTRANKNNLTFDLKLIGLNYLQCYKLNFETQNYGHMSSRMIQTVALSKHFRKLYFRACFSPVL